MNLHGILSHDHNDTHREEIFKIYSMSYFQARLTLATTLVIWGTPILHDFRFSISGHIRFHQTKR